MVGSSREEEKTISIAVIAVVAALALFGVVVVVTVAVTIPLQQAEAARPVGAGCPGTSPAANASKTRCFAG
jgi:amino acid transporter